MGCLARYLKIIYLAVDIGMTGRPADWRLDNSWRRQEEEEQEDAGANAASANASNHPPIISFVAPTGALYLVMRYCRSGKVAPFFLVTTQPSATV